MMHRSLALVFLLGLAAAPPAAAVETQLVLRERLGELAPMLGLKLGKKERKALEDAIADAQPEVRAAAVALLYGADPDAHQHELATLFAVPEPSSPRVVEPGEVDARVAALVEACGGEVPKEFEPLLAFLAYKDDAACFDTPTGPTSVARFYRNAFLSLAWAEAESGGRVDRKRVLHGIDHPAATP